MAFYLQEDSMDKRDNEKQNKPTFYELRELYQLLGQCIVKGKYEVVRAIDDLIKRKMGETV